MDESNVEKICEAIFNLIPEVTRLKELFQNWNLLDEEEKMYIDMQVEKWNSPGHVQLYKTVKEALVRWGKVQDTEGAPGCEPGWFTFSCDTQLEEELISVLQTIESLLKRAKKVSQMITKLSRLTREVIEMSLADFIETSVFASLSKTNFGNLTAMLKELTAVTLPEVPPSSPDSESDDFVLLTSPEKRKSEPIRTCGRSHSLHSGRRVCHHCCSAKSAPLIKDGYHTD